jgi:hypothetical protein
VAPVEAVADRVVAPEAAGSASGSASGWAVLAGLAVTYSSAACAAVPSALRVFTAEFGMGSGVLPLAMATRPFQKPVISNQSEQRQLAPSAL